MYVVVLVLLVLFMESQYSCFCFVVVVVLSFRFDLRASLSLCGTWAVLLTNSRPWQTGGPAILVWVAPSSRSMPSLSPMPVQVRYLTPTPVCMQRPRCSSFCGTWPWRATGGANWNPSFRMRVCACACACVCVCVWCAFLV